MTHKKIKIRFLSEFYRKHKIKLIIALIVFIAICLAAQLYLFFNEKLDENDLKFESIVWSEFCDGKIYTPEEKEEFCQKCLEQGGEECLWPLDMNIEIKKVEGTRRTGGEVHCYIIIDDVNYYKEKGSYYGVVNKSLFTWQKLDASKPHTIEFCCGIERETAVTNILMLEKKWPQACVKEEVQPRCGLID